MIGTPKDKNETCYRLVWSLVLGYLQNFKVDMVDIGLGLNNYKFPKFIA